METPFSSKTVLVTGAAAGIGRATALAFARQGGKLVVADINEEGGEETVAMIRDAGGEAAFFRADVAHAESVSALVSFAVDTFGSLDIGINNAGVGGPFTRLEHLSHEDYHQVIGVNLNGVYYCMQEQIRQMLQQGGGAIVNVSSIAGLRGLANSAAYSASKHAVLGLTKSVALEYARKNIRVNAVCPVFTRSAMFDQLFNIDPSYKEKLRKVIPMNRYGQPEDIANAIVWLCSDQAEFTTGLCLPLDGGMMAG